MYSHVIFEWGYEPIRNRLLYDLYQNENRVYQGTIWRQTLQIRRQVQLQGVYELAEKVSGRTGSKMGVIVGG